MHLFKLFLASALSAAVTITPSAIAQVRKPGGSAPTAIPGGAAPQWRGPSPEQQAELLALRKEVDRIGQEVGAAKQQDDKYSGGLIKAQIQSRIEIMRSTLALLEHRIAALETGARFVPKEVGGVPPADATTLQSLETEIVASKERIAGTTAQSDRYIGGLIKAQIDSTRATQEQTLAMLEQRYLMAKYGMTHVAARPSTEVRTSSTTTVGEKKPAIKEPSLAETILTINLLSKRRVKQKYDEMLILDMDVTAAGLDRPARAIKGVLKVTDLFGDEKVLINWDFDNSLAPGGTVRERDKGLKYNQFRDQDRWLDSTEQQNMKVTFTVKSILYEDGSRRDF
jgi:hypothetical protein